MACQFRWMVEPDVHPSRPARTPWTGEVTVPVLLARQEADIVSLPDSCHERRVQGAPCADELVAAGRVEAQNCVKDEAVGDLVVDLA